jgi:diamine N-acetyltransferase
MNLIFKVADLTHVETLVQFMREYYEYDGLDFDADNSRAALEMLLSNKLYGQIWLLQDGETPIGYVVLTFGFSLEAQGRDALVDELYVREDYRGQGVGARTLEFLEDFCRSMEIYAFYLEVERHNTKAQNFYHKHGFVDGDRCLLSKWLKT